MSRDVSRGSLGRFATPWGEGVVSVRDERLVGVELPPLRDLWADEAGAWVEPRDRAALDRWTGELETYFRGERLQWSRPEVPLDHLPLGEFDRKVYETLLTVPAACTVSYGALAEMAGYPRAARAVGNAMAANPIPIVVPCHRVIRSDGTLGNYGSEPAWKERLLEHERMHSSGSRGST